MRYAGPIDSLVQSLCNNVGLCVVNSGLFQRTNNLSAKVGSRQAAPYMFNIMSPMDCEGYCNGTRDKKC